jgi:hypothetical protein
MRTMPRKPKQNPVDPRAELYTGKSGAVIDPTDARDVQHWTCIVCGQPMARQGFTARGEGSGHRGRPRLYDTDECRLVASLLGLTEAGKEGTLPTNLRTVADRATPEAWATIRKKVWALMNMRAWNKGTPNLAFKRKRKEVAGPTLNEVRQRLKREQARLERKERKYLDLADQVRRGVATAHVERALPGMAREIEAQRLVVARAERDVTRVAKMGS